MDQPLLIEKRRVSGDQPLALAFNEFKVKCSNHPCCGSTDGALRYTHLFRSIASPSEPDQRVKEIQISNLNNQKAPALFKDN